MNRHSLITIFFTYSMLLFLAPMFVSCGSDDTDEKDAGLGDTGTIVDTGIVVDTGTTADTGIGDTSTTTDTGSTVMDSGMSDGNVDGTDAGEDSGPPATSVEVTTNKGVVVGGALDGVSAFLGIPYAAPPVGANRFRPPQEVTAWTEPLDATEFRPICPQYSLVTDEIDEDSDEDCLNLNVYTADPIPTTLRPVMVWLHPGAFIFGDGRDPYTGENFVEKGVVVVTLNYRMSALGFLAHPKLSEEDPSNVSGNYGLQDQTAALQWVQDNIAAFGGDKDNVTIFGESAGARSVCLHLLMLSSRGLFHRGIVESGLCTYPNLDMAAAEAEGERFAQAMGCTNPDEVLSCLRAIDANDLAGGPEEIAGGPTSPTLGGLFYYPRGNAFHFQPVSDGVVIPGQMEQLFESGAVAQVSVIQGANADEGALFHIGLFGDSPVTTEAEYRAALETRYGEQAADIVAQYPIADYASANDALTEVTGDAIFVCTSRRTARHLAAAGVTNYLYHFNLTVDGTPLPDLEGKSFHSADIPFVWGNDYILGNVTEANKPISEAMMDYWVRFAKTGDPNGDDAVTWPAYVETEDSYLNIDESIEVLSGLKKEKCDFWDTITPEL